MLDGGCDVPKPEPHGRGCDAGCAECRWAEERRVTALVSVWSAASRSLWTVDDGAAGVELRVGTVVALALALVFMFVCVFDVGPMGRFRGGTKVDELCARGPRIIVLERFGCSPVEAMSVAACKTGGAGALPVVPPLVALLVALSAVAGRTRRLLTISKGETGERGRLVIGWRLSTGFGDSARSVGVGGDGALISCN